MGLQSCHILCIRFVQIYVAWATSPLSCAASGFGVGLQWPVRAKEGPQKLGPAKAAGASLKAQAARLGKGSVGEAGGGIPGHAGARQSNGEAKAQGGAIWHPLVM